MPEESNPYQAPEASLVEPEAESGRPRPRFRARIIPATFVGLFGGLVVLGSFLIMILQIINRPRIDPESGDRYDRIIRAYWTAAWIMAAMVLVGGSLGIASSWFFMRRRWVVAILLAILMVVALVAWYPIVEYLVRRVRRED